MYIVIMIGCLECSIPSEFRYRAWVESDAQDYIDDNETDGSDTKLVIFHVPELG